MFTYKLILAALLSVGACMSSSKNTSQKTDGYQKPAVEADKEYDPLWKEVDSLENKGLTESALKAVDKIYAKAKKENNAGQLVKAVIHKMKFTTQKEENAYVKIIQNTEEELKTAQFPVKSVLHSLLADLYWNYYSQNRWKFHNRTETIEFKNDDIETWDLQKIVAKTTAHFEASLQDKDRLQNTEINVYDVILIDTYNKALKEKGRKLRPTLYDFLAHRAVDFFMNTEPDLTKPAYAFTLNNPELFTPAKDFSQLRIKTEDTSSMKFRALKVLQELTHFHLARGRKGKDNVISLIDVELKRLSFVHSHAVIENKDELYLNALEGLEKKHIDQAASAQVSYQIALYWYGKGAQYNPRQSEEHQFDYKKAYDICDKAIKRFPSSDGALNCESLRSQIAAKTMQLTIEKVNPSENSFRSLVTYKNLPKIHFRILKTTREEVEKLREKFYAEKYNYETEKELIKFFAAKDPLKKWTVELPDESDYQQHYTEAEIPGLDHGYYIILAGSAENMSTDSEAVAYTFTEISDLSYISRTTEDQKKQFFVTHRDTGKPLPGVKVQTWYENYNYDKRKYIRTSGGTYTTDKNGFATIPAPRSNNRSNFSAEFTLGKDKLLDNRFYHYTYSPPQKYKTLQSVLFLDRGIYRPGQTVYFKGILMERFGEDVSIAPGKSTTVTLYDANYQKVADVKVKSNEYGTFSGTFTAPTGAMNGQMRLQNENYGSVYFSVEEYKRPKFEALFDPVEGTYRLGENIKVTGLAKAYAGNNINGAEVRYRVVRGVTFPSWHFYRWGFFYHYSPDVEITNGVTETGDDGKFEIEFNAQPDESILKKYKPTFNYTVYADITEPSGETRSTQTYVRVGYNALELSIYTPEKLDRSGENEFQVASTNLNGQFESAEVTLTVHRLKDNGLLFRDRKWEKPDKHALNETAYRLKFPFDLYADENNPSRLEKEAKVFENSFKTEKDKKIKLNGLAKWKEGRYVLEMKTKDKFGQEVLSVNYFTVFDKNQAVLPVTEFAWFHTIKGMGEPGEKAEFLIGSGAKNVHVLYEIEHKGKIIKTEYLKLNNEKKLISIPIEEKHRGNFSAHFTFTKNGRVYHFDPTITVPWTNKQLDITLETFRNKLLPGQEEEWKVKITGEKGEKVAAEMLASAYDASLDAFRSNYWGLNLYNTFWAQRSWEPGQIDAVGDSQLYGPNWNNYVSGASVYYDQLNWFGFYYRGYYRGHYDYEDDGAVFRSQSIPKDAKKSMANAEMTEEYEPAPMADQVALGGVSKEKGEIKSSPPARLERDKNQVQQNSLDGVKARTNFNETAFFYPHLKTNEKGEIIFSFKVPEALTRWKFNALAHTKDLKYGQIGEEFVTQKDLMVVPNAPRFFREDDEITFTARISNISEKDLSGESRLRLFDAVTMKPVDQLFNKENKSFSDQSFTVKKDQSTVVHWTLNVPEGVGAVTYRITAAAGNFTDGEERPVPIMTNRMLVTESMPLPVRGGQAKKFTFTKLVNSGKSTTMRNHKLTLEFTSNPAWYAVQALPYLMEYPYECAEQTFSRLYANSIASHIANANPKVKRVFDQWREAKGGNKEALLSNLEKNQELKSLLLEETPWVLHAQDETERKKRVGLLFDLNRMSNELNRATKKLVDMQKSSGSWPWFDGMPESRYITQHIICGFGKLDHLGVKNVRQGQLWNSVKSGVSYLDNEIRKDYKELKRLEKLNSIDLTKNHLNSTHIHYLYTRSFFTDLNIPSNTKEAFNYFKGQAEKYWVDNKNRYLQGMIALALHRYESKKVPAEIMKSLEENALHSEEMGMYWKSGFNSFYWFAAPIETHALMIEAFDEVAKDQKAVNDLKVWLLKQKQTQDWRTTKATTEACYALLLRGTDWLVSEEQVEIKLGNMTVDPRKMPDVKVEAGTGYFKTSWSGSDIKPEMGNVTISKKDEGVAWGGLYWQYFEQLDKITFHETPLKLNKKLFLERSSDRGPVITPVTENTKLKPGDRIKVRIELRVDRNMEYVHMKDMRASAFEPENVISRYKYQDGLGYYESTRDAATNFFFAYLPKGTYVFEYPLRVTHEGDFSNGITTIQSMYAPEFTSHSEGIRVSVKK